MNRIAARLPWHVPIILFITFVIHHLDRNLLAYSLPLIAQDFGWNDRQLGEYGQYILAAFFLSYGWAQMLISGPAERFGAKASIMLAITGFALSAFGVGLLGTSIVLLAAFRLMLGLVESVHVPMMSVITAQNFPVEARARANAIWSIGLIMATAASPLLLVPLLSQVGWHYSFVAIGALGLLIGLPLVALFIRPVTAAPPIMATGRDTAILRDTDFWLFTAAGIGNAIKGFGLLGWLPTYLVREKGINFEALGWPLTVIYVSGIVGTLLFAWVGDRLRKRIFLAWAGMLVSTVFTLLAGGAGTLLTLVVWFALSFVGQAGFGAQEMSTIQLIARGRSVGAVTGWYNGLTVLIGGVLGSMIPGAIIAATGKFEWALIAIAAAGMITAVCMAMIGRRNPEFD